jgi:queuosine precursor transporter
MFGMNEFIFIIHIATVLGFTLLFLLRGKGPLMGFIALQALLANLLVLKQTSLFGLTVTCSDVFAVGSILAMNLLQERYGKEAARQATSLCLIVLLFFVLAAQLHLLYIPATFDTAHSSYSAILSSTPRLIAASVITFYAAQSFDVWFFSKLRGALPLRILVSLMCSQFLDTVLFSWLGLYGQVESLFDVILFSFVTKSLVIVCSSLFSRLTQSVKSHDISL